MLTSKEREYIEKLQRRADYLSKRIIQAEGNGKDLSWDKAEYSALTWAVTRLQGAA